MFKAGVARCLITPPKGMTMFGYAVREGVAEGTDSDLYATTLVLADDSTRVAIISFDLTFIPNSLATSIRQDVGQRLRVPASHVLVNASHTHCGPTFPEFRYDDDEHQEHLRQIYLARLRTEIPNLADEATARLVPARIGTGVGEARIGINRREVDSDGTVILGENPLGPVDHEVRVIRVDDVGGRPIAVVFAHGCHPVMMGPKCLRWSADYLGVARDLVEHAVGGLSLYLQANAGDIDPITGIGTKQDDSNEKNRLGIVLGGEVLKVHSSIYTESVRGPRSFLGSLSKVSVYPRIPLQPEGDLGLAVRESSLDLMLHDFPPKELAVEILEKCESDLASLLSSDAPLAKLNVARRYRHWALALHHSITAGEKPRLKTSVQGIKIGQLAIVAFPGETFTKLGTEVKRLSPFDNTLFVGYSNGMACYIPTRDAFPREGWSITQRYLVPDMIVQDFVIPTALTPDAGDIVVGKSLEVLRELER